MDTKFQSSFIPKSSVMGRGAIHEKSSVFGTLSVIIFVISLLGTGGIFAYKKMMESSISNLQSELAAAEAAVDKAKIDELANFDNRIKSLEDILTGHVTISSYLDLLGDNMIKNLSFSSFNYSALDSEKPITATFVGVAPSYRAIAQEEAILLANPNVLSVKFADFALNKSGGVGFKLEADFKGNEFKWSSIVADKVTVPGAAATSTSTTTPIGSPNP